MAQREEARWLEGAYTVEGFMDFVEAAPENERYEFVDGAMRAMASPDYDHQDLVGYLFNSMYNFLTGKPCQAFVAPFDVYLTVHDKEKGRRDYVFEPDVLVVCDKGKIKKEGRGPGVHGAPDFVAEVVSPSSVRMDYLEKANVYLKAGVKEYWVVDPMRERVVAYWMPEGKGGDDGFDMKVYGLAEPVPARLFPGLAVDFSGRPGAAPP
jgi:Uma2 family endonuclease